MTRQETALGLLVEDAGRVIRVQPLRAWHHPEGPRASEGIVRGGKRCDRVSEARS
ncbi:hypothetical protein [Coleofasciculus sp. FACHB-1120]|uniref:hypothetical protein n=1 Tax=Coleofasciculus sp. FACHB-1120 TaxID=2692783 RepID=UPI00199154BC|nr:hypothetical protein [Coleofasciculus sp. FACHB-1120]MBD2742548.1 hypothetical protein [Coleofasciculus sp. FACHB-1120]